LSILTLNSIISFSIGICKKKYVINLNKNHNYIRQTQLIFYGKLCKKVNSFA